MSNNTTILERYNKWPEWVRWILFLPISFVFSILLWFFIASGAERVGAFSFVIEILHPVVVQVLFLALIFFTVPRGRLIWIKTLIILRALILVFFIAQPMLNFMGADLPYDIEFFKDLVGEILTLAASIWLFKELKEENAKNEVQQTQEA